MAHERGENGQRTLAETAESAPVWDIALSRLVLLCLCSSGSLGLSGVPPVDLRTWLVENP